MQTAVQNAASALKPFVPAGETPIGIVLGSGLGEYASTLQNPQYINYADIPEHPVSHVQGHIGRYVIGQKFGKTVIAMQGRFHFYEGNPQAQLATGIRAMYLVGVKRVILTNAAGGVNPSFHPGTLMMISDHINFSGSNPLIGKNNDDFGPRFPDQSEVYPQKLRDLLRERCAADGIALEEGVYMMFSGPCFETPAEIRAARVLGASAVGMSTVPEAIAAAHCGMEVLGLSLVTNLAAGILKQKLTHEEVQEAASAASVTFSHVIDIAVRDVL